MALGSVALQDAAPQSVVNFRTARINRTSLGGTDGVNHAIKSGSVGAGSDPSPSNALTGADAIVALGLGSEVGATGFVADGDGGAVVSITADCGSGGELPHAHATAVSTTTPSTRGGTRTNVRGSRGRRGS